MFGSKRRRAKRAAKAVKREKRAAASEAKATATVTAAQKSQEEDNALGRDVQAQDGTVAAAGGARDHITEAEPAQDEAAAPLAPAEDEPAGTRAEPAAVTEPAPGGKPSRKERRAMKKTAKKEAVAAKAAAQAAPKSMLQTLTDPKLASRVRATTKTLGPLVVPAVGKAAISVRGYFDEQKAQRLGIPAADVGAYRGPTGATLARIDALARSLGELKARRGGELQVTRLAEVSGARLADLRSAVSASGAMPSDHRRATLRAVGHELDRIEADVISTLVGPGVR